MERKRYIVIFGCDEWQDYQETDSREEAIQIATDGLEDTMGLYPADFAVVEDRETGETIHSESKEND